MAAPKARTVRVNSVPLNIADRMLSSHHELRTGAVSRPVARAAPYPMNFVRGLGSVKGVAQMRSGQEHVRQRFTSDTNRRAASDFRRGGGRRLQRAKVNS